MPNENSEVFLAPPVAAEKDEEVDSENKLSSFQSLLQGCYQGWSEDPSGFFYDKKYYSVHALSDPLKLKFSKLLFTSWNERADFFESLGTSLFLLQRDDFAGNFENLYDKQNILAERILITDKKVKEYFDSIQSTLPDNAQFEDMKENLKKHLAQLEQDKMEKETKVELKSKKGFSSFIAPVCPPQLKQQIHGISPIGPEKAPWQVTLVGGFGCTLCRTLWNDLSGFVSTRKSQDIRLTHAPIFKGEGSQGELFAKHAVCLKEEPEDLEKSFSSVLYRIPMESLRLAGRSAFNIASEHYGSYVSDWGKVLKCVESNEPDARIAEFRQLQANFDLDEWSPTVLVNNRLFGFPPDQVLENLKILLNQH